MCMSEQLIPATFPATSTVIIPLKIALLHHNHFHLSLFPPFPSKRLKLYISRF